jgi:nitrogen fixation NifU-like protein
MSELSDLYQEVIVDHSLHPHNYHAMPDASRKAEGYNPMCGDQVTVFLKMDGEKIADVSFQGNGCAISKSSASIMTDVLKGKSRPEAEELFRTFQNLIKGEGPAVNEEVLGKLAAFSGVHEFPTRVKCAILAWHTLRSALNDAKGRVSTE